MMSDSNETKEKRHKEHKKVDIRKIMEVINGSLDDRTPKCTISFTNEMYNVDTQDARTLIAKVLSKPVVNIRQHGKYINMDFLFKQSGDVDLKLLWKVFETYGTLMDSVDESSKEIPLNSVVIIPEAFSGVYFLMAQAPIFWTLQAPFPGKEATMIRLFYEQESVAVCKAELDVEGTFKVEKEKVQQEDAFQMKAMQKEEAKAKDNPYFELSNNDLATAENSVTAGNGGKNYYGNRKSEKELPETEKVKRIY